MEEERGRGRPSENGEGIMTPSSTLPAPFDLEGCLWQSLTCKVLEDDDDQGQDDGADAASPQKGVEA